MSPVSLRLAEFRKSKGLSQEALAKLSRVSQSRISRLESGAAESVDFETLDRLATALGIDAALLIQHTPKPKR